MSVTDVTDIYIITPESHFVKSTGTRSKLHLFLSLFLAKIMLGGCLDAVCGGCCLSLVAAVV